jgi:hypothetical protein
MKTRVHWDEDQIESIAAAFVRLRTKEPFVAYTKYLAKAQEECIVPDERRKLCTVNAVPLLKTRIQALWEKAIQSEPTPPQIIEIPVEKTPDFAEIAARLDAPTLVAMLTKRVTDALSGLHLANGLERPLAPTKAAPLASILTPPPPPPRPPRVAFLHVELKFFSELQAEVERLKIPVELRGVDIHHKGAPKIPMSADFVVFMKNATGGLAMKTALVGWHRSRVYVLEQDTMQQAVKTLYDILSKKIHVPATLPAPAPARV